MNFEERYFELLENYDRAKDNYAKNPTITEWNKVQQAERTFMTFSVFVLEKILEKNQNILENLK